MKKQPGRRAVRVRAGWAIGGACVGLGAAAIGLRLATGPGAAGRGATAGLQVSGINDTLQGLAGVLPATLIVTRRPALSIGWLSLAIAAGFSVAGFAAEYARAAVIGPLPGLPGPALGLWLGQRAPAVINVFVVSLLFLFPTGRLLSRRWRPLLAAALAGPVLQAVISFVYPGPLAVAAPGARPALGPLGRLVNPFGIRGAETLMRQVFPVTLIGIAAGFLCGLGCIVVRFRRAGAEERAQIKWVTWAAALVAATPALLLVVPGSALNWVLPPVISLGFSGAAAVAVVKYRLYDIDVVINRTLVYAALTVAVTGVYIGLVTASGGLWHGSRLVPSLLVTGVVAAAFAPARSRLQRAVDRLMYGDRADPYLVLSRLGERLAAAVSPDLVLPDLADSVAVALKLPYAAVELATAEGPRITASHGTPVADLVRLPMTHQGQVVGHLLAGARSPRELFSPADERLLTALAHQAGVAGHAVALHHALQRSRERLVTSLEEERRRLRRDLHDGLGPTLAAMTLKLDAARRLADTDLPGGVALLGEVKADVQAALADIRRLVYRLRPPALDELGLAGAVRQHAATFTGSAAGRPGLAVLVDAPARLDSLPAAVEAAAYLIITEAITNVGRHAGATRCQVRLDLSDALELEISDDGTGIPPDAHHGVGLSSMRERADELGGVCVIASPASGGTQIRARLPLTPAPAPAPALEAQP